MQDSSTVRSKILGATSYEFKLLLRGILLPACIISFFTYVIITIIDTERSGYYNSIPSAVILILGTIISLKLLIKKLVTIIESVEDKWIFYDILMQHKHMLHQQIDLLIKEKRKYKKYSRILVG